MVVMSINGNVGYPKNDDAEAKSVLHCVADAVRTNV